MFLVFFALPTCVLVMCVTCSQPFVFAFSGSLLSQEAMDRLSSSASTATSIDDYSEHNMWNPPLELLFLKHVNGTVDSYLVDFDLAKIAFSCHVVCKLTKLPKPRTGITWKREETVCIIDKILVSSLHHVLALTISPLLHHFF